MWVFLHENYSSNVSSSTSRFFHLMRHLVIARFLIYLVLISKIASSSSIVFPSSVIFDIRVWTRILSLITLFKQETGRIDVHVNMGGAPIFTAYFQSSKTKYRGCNTLELIYCPYFFAWGTYVYMVVVS